MPTPRSHFRSPLCVVTTIFKSSWITHQYQLGDLLEEQEALFAKTAEDHNVSAARVKRLANQAPALKPKKKASDYNILFFYKNRELNGDRPSGSKLSSKLIHEAVKDDDELQEIRNSASAMEELRKCYMEDKDDEDVATLAPFNKASSGAQSDFLYDTLDITSFGLVVRSLLESTAMASYFGRGPVDEFLRSEYGVGIQVFTQHFETWLLARNAKLSKKMSATDMAKDLTRLISRGLSEITGIKDITMNYASYEASICVPYHVAVKDWPSSVPWSYPQKLAADEASSAVAAADEHSDNDSTHSDSSTDNNPRPTKKSKASRASSSKAASKTSLASCKTSSNSKKRHHDEGSSKGKLVGKKKAAEKKKKRSKPKKSVRFIANDDEEEEEDHSSDEESDAAFSGSDDDHMIASHVSGIPIPDFLAQLLHSEQSQCTGSLNAVNNQEDPETRRFQVARSLPAMISGIVPSSYGVYQPNSTTYKAQVTYCAVLLSTRGLIEQYKPLCTGVESKPRPNLFQNQANHKLMIRPKFIFPILGIIFVFLASTTAPEVFAAPISFSRFCAGPSGTDSAIQEEWLTGTTGDAPKSQSWDSAASTAVHGFKMEDFRVKRLLIPHAPAPKKKQNQKDHPNLRAWLKGQNPLHRRSRPRHSQLPQAIERQSEPGSSGSSHAEPHTLRDDQHHSPPPNPARQDADVSGGQSEAGFLHAVPSPPHDTQPTPHMILNELEATLRGFMDEVNQMPTFEVYRAFMDRMRPSVTGISGQARQMLADTTLPDQDETLARWLIANVRLLVVECEDAAVRVAIEYNSRLGRYTVANAIAEGHISYDQLHHDYEPIVYVPPMQGAGAPQQGTHTQQNGGGHPSDGTWPAHEYEGHGNEEYGHGEHGYEGHGNEPWPEDGRWQLKCMLDIHIYEIKRYWNSGIPVPRKYKCK
ncbi:hypothetical protein C8R42DRAFT_640288 [Lentinula raphanica]|nr:hypothetical protein C8R42DRAFT_640288 [Lentinula raphanica]